MISLAASILCQAPWNDFESRVPFVGAARGRFVSNTPIGYTQLFELESMDYAYCETLSFANSLFW